MGDFDYETAFDRNIGWVTREELALLRGKRVAIAGLGGVGGSHLLTLTRLGIGAFNLAELDTFELANFNRQAGATLRSVGRPKLDVLAELALDVNPELQLRRFPQGLTAENVPEFLAGADVYLDALDFFAIDIRRRVFSAALAKGIPVVTAPNLIEATQDCGAFVQLSGVLKRVAVKISKVCNDLRLLSSGPRAGLGEINLPPRQAGSSIMPGKVNPVIPEVVNQIAFEVIGNDMTVSFAAEGGQLQLNAFEPIIAHSLFKSVLHLSRGCTVLADLCVDGITANKDALRASVERSIGIVTALNPYIGYANATEVAAIAHATGKGVAEIVLERGLMSAEQLDEVLRPEVLTRPRPLPVRG